MLSPERFDISECKYGKASQQNTMADQTSLRFLRSRILLTENLSAAGNFERKGAISYVKDRQRGKKRENFSKLKTIYNWYRIQLLNIKNGGENDFQTQSDSENSP